jgi:hypothetical protein
MKVDSFESLSEKAHDMLGIIEPLDRPVQKKLDNDHN